MPFDWNNRARQWQIEAIQAERNKRDTNEPFVLEACPGAGKSAFAGWVAADWIADGICKHVIVLAPWKAIQTSLITTFERDFALQCTGRFFSGSHRKYVNSPPETDCTVTTWKEIQDDAAIRMLHDWIEKENFSFGLIVDEVHHGEDQLPWGGMIKELTEMAKRTVLMSGTLFRTKGVIANIRLDDKQYAIPDYAIEYKAAASAGWVRNVSIRWVGFDVDIHDVPTNSEYKLKHDSISSKADIQATKAYVFDPDSETIGEIISQVHEQTIAWRASKFPNAKALFVARGGNDQTGDRNVVKLKKRVAEITGCPVEMVTHKDRDAVAIIERFRKNPTPYIVAIGMISEGVDIPNIRTIGLCRLIESRMLFYQIAGRAMRVIEGEDDGTAAAIYLPKIFPMDEYGEELALQTKDVMRIVENNLCPVCFELKTQCKCPCAFCGVSPKRNCVCPRCEVCKRKVQYCICQKAVEKVVLEDMAYGTGGHIYKNSVSESYVATADFIRQSYPQHAHLERVQLAHVLEVGNTFHGVSTAAAVVDATAKRRQLKKKINRLARRIAARWYRGNWKEAFKSEVFPLLGIRRIAELDRLKVDTVQEKYDLLKLRFTDLLGGEHDGNCD